MNLCDVQAYLEALSAFRTLIWPGKTSCITRFERALIANLRRRLPSRRAGYAKTKSMTADRQLHDDGGLLEFLVASEAVSLQILL